MPNWCNNRLTVNGPADVLDRWLAAQTSPQSQHDDRPRNTLLFSAQVPVPGPVIARQQALETAYKAGEPAPPVTGPQVQPQVDWQREHWGTKWEVQSGNAWTERVDPQELEVNFDTANRPPGAWLKAVAPLWPDLDFRLEYIEPGCNFCGELALEAGEITEEDQREVSGEDREAWGYEQEAWDE